MLYIIRFYSVLEKSSLKSSIGSYICGSGDALQGGQELILLLYPLLHCLYMYIYIYMFPNFLFNCKLE